MSQTDLPKPRRTIRKRLSHDCLFEGDLHPNVAERLRKIQELPVAPIAHFYGAERDHEGDWLVWQFIDGITLEEFLTREPSRTDCGQIAQQLSTTVQAMHAHGIVHGALHERNVIIDSSGKVHLTHISPLLWDDEQVDREAMDQLLEQLNMLDLTGGEDSPEHPRDDPEEMAIRQRIYLVFTFVLLLGLISFASILWYIRGR